MKILKRFKGLIVFFLVMAALIVLVMLPIIFAMPASPCVPTREPSMPLEND